MGKKTSLGKYLKRNHLSNSRIILLAAFAFAGVLFYFNKYRNNQLVTADANLGFNNKEYKILETNKLRNVNKNLGVDKFPSFVQKTIEDDSDKYDETDTNNNNEDTIDTIENTEDDDEDDDEEDQQEEMEDDEETEETEDDISDNGFTSKVSNKGSSSSNNPVDFQPDEDGDIDSENEREDDPEVEDGTSDRFLPIPARIVPRYPLTFVNYRTAKCSYFCNIMSSIGYRPVSVSPLKTPPELLLISYKKYPFYSSLRRTMINQVGRGSSCIGGGKGRQLSCRESLANDNGCDFSTLKVQPPQWNIQTSSKCKEFYNIAERTEHRETIWIAKPGGSYHGKGITIHDTVDSLKKMFGTCQKTLQDGVIIQEYIKYPALMQGHKFDFRSYLLIASTDPFIVFYHDGFVRKAMGVYSTDSDSLKDPLKQVTNDVNQDSNDHFFSFEQLQKVLSKENGFEPEFMTKVFVPHAMRVTNYLFNSGYNRTKGFIPTPGRYQLFALDWMVDAKGGLHLLEANGNPLIADYPGTSLTPKLWTSMAELVRLLHVTPEKIKGKLSVEDGYRYSGWKLVYNQVEVEAKKMNYEACKFNKYAATGHPLYSYTHYGK